MDGWWEETDVAAQVLRLEEDEMKKKRRSAVYSVQCTEYSEC